MASPAGTVILPMQDIMGLDDGARMNVPGTPAGNWSWRWRPAQPGRHARRLRDLTEQAGRIPVARAKKRR